MTQVMGWAEVAQLRQGLYRFFGGALLSPDDDRVENLVAAAGYLDALGIEAFAFAGPWDAMLDTFENLPSSEALSAEYIRLFASGMNRELCPPTESFYRASAEGGGAAMAVAAIQRRYRRLGFGPAMATEPPDHASTELEAMAGLCSREVDHWESMRPGQVCTTLSCEHEFLRHHLATWFPAFRARVKRAGAVPFYAATVDAAHAFIIHEVDFVGFMLQAIEDER